MKYFLLIVMLTVHFMTNSQELENYKWSNRILLVISQNEASDIVQLQIERLKNKPKELTERKLLIYRLHPNQYKIENNKNTNWVIGSELYKIYNKQDVEFKVILIGLDGGIKLSQNNILTADTLFMKIDSMPMRASELKNKQ